MTKLEDVQPNASFRGILPDALTTVVRCKMEVEDRVRILHKVEVTEELL